MNDTIITIGLYFEIRDSEMYGGKGTVGYASTMIECSVENITSEKINNYVDSQIEGVASMCTVPAENVKLIPRTEYEENTED